MRGDERQLDPAREDSGTRNGPRHAAPRKSLLTKLHIPAGKAFALAAMPTAVLVGMGLTPKLALADDSSDIPFAPGPCVTRSDEPSEEPSPSASKSSSPIPSATATGSGDQDDTATPKPSTTPSASDKAEPRTKAAGADAPAAAPSASPTPTKTRNPLDPLGVGDALRDLFDGPDKETASPSPSASTASPKPSRTDTAKKSDEKPVEKPADAAKETADKTADAIREAAGRAGRTVEELDDSAKGLDAKKDEDIPDGAKERFPCPTPDPEALAAADLETGVPLLPTDPWILESSMLTLNGLDYKGIVEVKTYNGTVKKVLKFTASSIDIDNLHQKTVGPAGTTAHVEARKGSKSTIRDGTVTMYTEELKGNLFGLIPVTFSPRTPPPLNVPFAFFTKVKVTQAGQFGGTLTVPGLHNYFTGGNS
ncbi:hypothetical protein [Streptomyces sp. JV184]|uniref:hypothetical protein n=1 Tax=Streptomyces sp. JV184 TaxID=858637 RepID=UPI002E77249D|nr:hypothetical protein [Streptomyces sp. JV184]MEE1747988.1 hypothetical protein [Streptomyces sp. JV184]